MPSRQYNNFQIDRVHEVTEGYKIFKNKSNGWSIIESQDLSRGRKRWRDLLNTIIPFIFPLRNSFCSPSGML
jgi:hypothetical protein